MRDVRSLIEGRGKVVAVSEDATVREAVELMLANDYHQLPVLGAAGRPRGIVSVYSLTRVSSFMELPMSQLPLYTAIEPAPHFRLDDDVSEVLVALKTYYVVLVVNHAGELVGLVTPYDALEFFRRSTEDEMVVREIEVVVRKCLEAVDRVDKLEVSESTRRPSLNDYIQRLTSERTWSKLGGPMALTREQATKLLDAARQTRNALAHLNPISEVQRHGIRFCLRWLTSVLPEVERRFPLPVVSTNETGPPEVIEPPEVLPLEDVAATGDRLSGLAVHLQGAPRSERRSELTFEQIERLIASSLPEAAHRQAFWDNDTDENPRARSWIDIGWRVERVDSGAQVVWFRREATREQAYLDFFRSLVEALAKVRDSSLRPAQPQGRNWLVLGRLPRTRPCASLVFSFSRDRRSRVELYIDAGDRTRNKALFDRLKLRELEIESALGEKVEWERLDDARASRIACYRDVFITDNEASLAGLLTWATALAPRFSSVMEHELAMLAP